MSPPTRPRLRPPPGDLSELTVSGSVRRAFFLVLFSTTLPCVSRLGIRKTGQNSRVVMQSGFGFHRSGSGCRLVSACAGSPELTQEHTGGSSQLSQPPDCRTYSAEVTCLSSNLQHHRSLAFSRVPLYGITFCPQSQENIPRKSTSF